MTGRPLRVAMLAHSTIPRGGVVHALELGEALTRLGHDVVVHAPDADRLGFFRPTLCATAPLAATPGPFADTHAMVRARIADYLRHFEHQPHRRFDLFHAQDSLSANALASLKQAGCIAGFVRTVHHVDVFADTRLAALQRRAITRADAHFVVSPSWQAALRDSFGLDSTVVGNGVDLRRFSPRPDPRDSILRDRLGLGGGPIYLAVGGVEARKNTLRLLQAFTEVRRVQPDAQLVVAGGRSLLDHGAYQARYAAERAASHLPAHAVVETGPLADADMPALYRNADAMVFPSLKEGFGLVVLEALASGLPVVVSRQPPFTGYLAENDAIWCDPDSVASIAGAMIGAPDLKPRMMTDGPAIAGRHDWLETARSHLPVYQRLGAFEHA